MLKIFSFIILFVLIIFAVTWMFLGSKHPTTQPYNAVYYYYLSLIQPQREMKKEVIGFLPYWRMEDVQYLHHDLLGEINYFALYADAQGNIVKLNDGNSEPGWLNWQSEKLRNLAARTQISGGKFSVTIALHRTDLIEEMLDDTKAQQTLVKNITKQITDYRLDGVNIDFEISSKINRKYQAKFTNLIKKLKTELSVINPEVKLYISVPVLAARNENLFEFNKLKPLADKFIVMSYEYYSSGSDIAGPTAPIGGFKENKYFFDIKTTYSDYLKVLPKNKIVMGVPYYGRDWAVVDGEMTLGETFSADEAENYSAIISYAYARGDKNLKRENCEWDNTAMQTMCRYKDGKTKTDHQVWIEDNRSIGLKFDFANRSNFSGIAIWALGFDKGHPDLWEMISDKFGK